MNDLTKYKYELARIYEHSIEYEDLVSKVDAKTSYDEVGK